MRNNYKFWKSPKVDFMVWSVDTKKCMICGACISVCPVNALRLTEHGVEVDKKKCILCGTCVTICPVKAIKVEKDE